MLPKLRAVHAGAVVCALLVASTASAQPCNPSAERDECIEREIFFMPGVQGVIFFPAAAQDPFVGGGVQLVPLHWSHNNDRFGPSQGALYMQASILQSASSPGSMALYDAGFSLSFERNASRRVGVPYFGAAVGGASHTKLPNSGYAYPHAGAHLYWHHHLVLNAEGGYHFPFSDIDQMRGPRGELTARFSMW